jgi:hypothetical protein
MISVGLGLDKTYEEANGHLPRTSPVFNIHPWLSTINPNIQIYILSLSRPFTFSLASHLSLAALPQLTNYSADTATRRYASPTPMYQSGDGWFCPISYSAPNVLRTPGQEARGKFPLQGI